MSLQVKIIAALIGLLALGASLWLLEQHGYDRGLAACQATQRKEDHKIEEKHEKVVVSADAGMQKATDTGAQEKAVTEQKSAETVRIVTKVIHDAPSPVSCSVQPDSLRALADAANRANAAADRLRGTGAGASPSAASSSAKP